jgi:hypothetical protein
MLIQLLEEEDPFSCLLSIQCSIEVFAAQAATPIEKAIAQSMRAMSEEMMRRNPNPRHPQGNTARRFIEETQRPRSLPTRAQVVTAFRSGSYRIQHVHSCPLRVQCR